jgi:two-component system KDP operon response regulator KdpE
MNATAGRVLIVESDASRRTLLRTTLAQHGYEVSEASDGVQALGHVAWREPSVVLLDLGLPDIDGVQVVGRIREQSDVPIVVTSERNDESEIITVLDRGANYFLTKPVGMGALLARIRALLQRSRAIDRTPVVLSIGNLDLDLVGHVVRLSGTEVPLSKTEYAFLRVLATRKGHAVSHRKLLTLVWGPAFVDHVEYLRVVVRRLRRKLEVVPSEPRLLVTVPGVGYLLQPELCLPENSTYESKRIT